MGQPDRKRVTARSEVSGALASPDMTVVRFATAEGAVLDVAERDDRDSVCAVLNDEMDHDLMVALVSVLAVSGVGAFETSQAQAVQRILDMKSVISAGELKVLRS